jgi:hypothetical protein
LVGFEGNRHAAFQALHFTSRSDDLRSAFADITLVAHSVMGQQLFGYSEVEMYLQADELNVLLDKNLKRFPNSWVFLMQKAKFHMVLMKDLNNALCSFALTLENVQSTVAIKCVALYEIGLIHLLNMDYDKALGCFVAFSKDSKWSDSFNTLLAILINGSLDDLKMASQILKQASGKPTQKRNPIENYAHRRLEYLKKHSIKSKTTCQFFLIELLFLWMYIPYGESNKLNEMLASK